MSCARAARTSRRNIFRTAATTSRGRRNCRRRISYATRSGSLSRRRLRDPSIFVPKRHRLQPASLRFPGSRNTDWSLCDQDHRSIIPVMKAMTVNIPGPIEEHPLAPVDIAPPEPAAGEILVRVKTCGVCRTDLHVSEGDLPTHREHVIPGHEVVGVIESLGAGCEHYRVGERVGIAWLRETCGI